MSIKRTPDKWSYDGRVPLEAQPGETMCGDNDLDRGHLVRREDPNWGTQEEALTANDDTFHFTNCSPQMHAMNAVTWVGLESYVLKNARVWKERVTVFTGPVFGVDDLTYRGVRIPIAFWKVLSFLSDSGRPSATAYMVDQENELSTLEAAFGRYKTYQRSIRYVEQVTGLSFGRLKTYDGFSNEEIQNGIPRGRVRVETILESPDDIPVLAAFLLEPVGLTVEALISKRLLHRLSLEGTAGFEGSFSGPKRLPVPDFVPPPGKAAADHRHGQSDHNQPHHVYETLPAR